MNKITKRELTDKQKSLLEYWSMRNDQSKKWGRTIQA